MENAFLELVKRNNGFEICLGFRDDEDHFIGGTGNTVWYLVVKKKNQELWIGELDGGAWTDKHVVKKKTVTEKAADAGTTVAKIMERLYFKQDEIAASGRKPVATEIHELKCSHYVYSFGARAYDILDDYGVTACYSNIDDEMAGYRFRDVHVGENVMVPKVK